MGSSCHLVCRLSSAFEGASLPLFPVLPLAKSSWNLNLLRRDGNKSQGKPGPSRDTMLQRHGSVYFSCFLQDSPYRVCTLICSPMYMDHSSIHQRKGNLVAIRTLGRDAKFQLHTIELGEALSIQIGNTRRSFAWRLIVLTRLYVHKNMAYR
ncbi:hypothetical protein WG66_007316 [Moniliophthora roreri]|nr:hypothetical protein WG66_007316 [Moniliophthora roreri]